MLSFAVIRVGVGMVVVLHTDFKTEPYLFTIQQTWMSFQLENRPEILATSSIDRAPEYGSLSGWKVYLQTI